MKLHTILLTSILCLNSTMATDINNTTPLNVKQEGIKYIKILASTLKTNLKVHMKNDPSGLDALAFCTGNANRITKEVNAKLPSYAKVRRTALKIRNKSTNQPDTTDKKIIKIYESSILDKTFLSKDIKMIQEGNITRIYKPLVIKGVCLKCHGNNLDPKIANAIKHAYPKDKAIGYKEGDLRGVIVSEIIKH